MNIYWILWGMNTKKEKQVDKQSFHFYQGNPINLHYPLVFQSLGRTQYTQIQCRSYMSMIWSLEISRILFFSIVFWWAWDLQEFSNLPVFLFPCLHFEVFSYSASSVGTSLRSFRLFVDTGVRDSFCSWSRWAFVGIRTLEGRILGELQYTFKEVTLMSGLFPSFSSDIRYAVFFIWDL